MEKFFLKHKEYNICVYKKGQGEIPILFLHGAGGDFSMLSWEEVMNLLDENHTSYAIDLLGHGESDKPKDMAGDEFYEKHLSCLEDIVNQLKLNKFILCGISMGGAIAIYYTLRNQAKVEGLIAVDPWGLSEKMYFHKICYFFINTSITRKSFNYLGKHKWPIKPMIRCSLIGDKSKISDELVEDIHEVCRKNEAGKTMEDFQRSSIKKFRNVPDFTKDLSKISVPTLFINGEKDPLVKAENIIEKVKLMKNSQVYIMNKCKHWTVKERPEEFVEVIEDFIKSIK